MATSTVNPPFIAPPPAARAATNGNSTNPPLTLHEVKPPLALPNYWLYAVIALALLLLATAILFAYLRKRRKPQLPPVAAVLIPPHRRALDRLRAALAFIDEPKTFISQVADTLRIYLEERFQLHAPERTSEEFLQEIQSSPALLPGQKELLGDFLTRCDLVKFARHEPARPELDALWHTAKKLVEETSPEASTPAAPLPSPTHPSHPTPAPNITP